MWGGTARGHSHSPQPVPEIKPCPVEASQSLPWGICVYPPACPTLLLLGTVFISCLQSSAWDCSEPAGKGPELNLEVHLHRAVCVVCPWWGRLGDPLHTWGWRVGLGAPLQLRISNGITLELCHTVLNPIPLSCSPPQVL